MIPVFYSPRMSVDSGGFSPSASKPAKVVEAWLSEGFPIQIREPLRATLPMLDKAHDPGFVRGIMLGDIKNGHGNTSYRVASTLPLTSGAMVSAAKAAIENEIGAVAPVSGFHHAGYDSASGFCTFNGLMVAAMALPDDEVGILDFDYHYGNGTEEIIRRLDQGSRITHYSQGQWADPEPEQWLARLSRLLERFEFCDVVLYQAGADPHVDDPLGGFLTTEQLFERDRIVFKKLRAMGVPVAWNLAGGYQDDFAKVIEIHTNTMKAFIESFNSREK